MVVAAEFHAKDALRGATRYFNDLGAIERCRRQHALMMRTMHSGQRTLQRMQAERQKAEDAMHPTALLRAGHLHSGTLPPEPDPPPSQPAATPEPQPPARPPPARPTFEDMTEAEQYAVTRPDRAVAIRRCGAMPPGATFPPPDRAIISEIATSSSPVFLAAMLNSRRTLSQNPRHCLSKRFHETTMRLQPRNPRCTPPPAPRTFCLKSYRLAGLRQGKTRQAAG